MVLSLSLFWHVVLKVPLNLHSKKYSTKIKGILADFIISLLWVDKYENMSIAQLITTLVEILSKINDDK